MLCLCLWAGNWLGYWLVGPIHVEVPELKDLPIKLPPPDQSRLRTDPMAFGPALVAVAALIFAVSGLTMWLSARGRFRWRVLGVAVFFFLVQFLLNLIGQMWPEAFGWARPLTVFYYYQPQQIILGQGWTVDLGVWNGGQPLVAVPGAAVLFGVGIVGYALALRTFIAARRCRRRCRLQAHPLQLVGFRLHSSATTGRLKPSRPATKSGGAGPGEIVQGVFVEVGHHAPLPFGEDALEPATLLDHAHVFRLEAVEQGDRLEVAQDVAQAHLLRRPGEDGAAVAAAAAADVALPGQVLHHLGDVVGRDAEIASKSPPLCRVGRRARTGRAGCARHNR